MVTVATIVVLLLVDPRTGLGEAIKTGGLAGGSIVALYALWLNDRRRRTEEARHDLESVKIADERFARAVEMLGHDADQVRVGAMHALANLARTTPRYKQTVLDVLCAYLRRPFTHEAFTTTPADPDQSGVEQGDQDRERTVRLTAQRLITDLLPWGMDTDPVLYHLDLTGANLEYLRLEGRRVGRLTARRARFHGITAFRGATFGKPVLLSGAIFHGRLDLREARFDGGIAFTDTTFSGRVELSDATVGTFLALAPEPPADVRGTLTLGADVALRTPDQGWPLAKPAGDEPAG
nr:pentapeptide repeat-containing protein [Saccharothrix violaceirubra]